MYRFLKNVFGDKAPTFEDFKSAVEADKNIKLIKPKALLHPQNKFVQNSCKQKRKPLKIAVFSVFGGDEGNRTPVRKSLTKTFYECSLSFTFPLHSADKQALYISNL